MNPFREWWRLLRLPWIESPTLAGPAPLEGLSTSPSSSQPCRSQCTPFINGRLPAHGGLSSKQQAVIDHAERSYGITLSTYPHDGQFDCEWNADLGDIIFTEKKDKDMQRGTVGDVWRTAEGRLRVIVELYPGRANVKCGVCKNLAKMMEGAPWHGLKSGDSVKLSRDNMAAHWMVTRFVSRPDFTRKEQHMNKVSLRDKGTGLPTIGSLPSGAVFQCPAGSVFYMKLQGFDGVYRSKEPLGCESKCVSVNLVNGNLYTYGEYKEVRVVPAGSVIEINTGDGC